MHYSFRFVIRFVSVSENEEVTQEPIIRFTCGTGAGDRLKCCL